ncbi:hypothetical protein J2W36_005274 [Variovorax ginsengisoli]|uniref:Uncharacterized protein n=1 Tax=Variovorax ginsengisoli TaxID=363844 RepID=A0ABT9SF52_9BURK|nr:hypothetical protein [Variovorax ginsengisoli]
MIDPLRRVRASVLDIVPFPSQVRAVTQASERAIRVPD